MIAKKYMNVVQLRELLLGMERDLGMGHLFQNEKDVFYAVNSVIYARNGIGKSDEIKSHDLLREMTQPTFHRCLKKLANIKLLAHAPNTKAGSYVSTQQTDYESESI